MQYPGQMGLTHQFWPKVMAMEARASHFQILFGHVLLRLTEPSIIEFRTSVRNALFWMETSLVGCRFPGTLHDWSDRDELMAIWMLKAQQSSCWSGRVYDVS